MSVIIGTNTENYSNYTTGAVANSTNAVAEKIEDKAIESIKDTGAVYDKTTQPEKKVTYSINKMSAEDRAALVQKMKQNELDRRSQLSSLVQQMFSKQAGKSKLADLFSGENLKNVSATDIAQAKEDVSEDGYWGVKQTSQRLFDFASALAGDDVEKMKEMQAAMEKGFKLATKAWGHDLPSISHDTLDAANKLFDDYYASKKVSETEA